MVLTPKQKAFTEKVAAEKKAKHDATPDRAIRSAEKELKKNTLPDDARRAREREAREKQHAADAKKYSKS